MKNAFKHFILITKHRNRVIKNAAHTGIFWHALKHDLTKYGHLEFSTSTKYYKGDHSPVFEERLSNEYFSKVCQHHTKRNPHHWEYWADFFAGRVIAKQMPWKYAIEYVCDMVSASYTYSPKTFTRESPYKYFIGKCSHYFMNDGTKEFLIWALKEYADNGWKNLNKKNTKIKYQEINSKYPKVQFFETCVEQVSLPELKK